MKFNDRYMYTILCEDRQTLEFIKHLLKIQGINTRKIYSIIAESGIGSAEAFVRREYPKRLKAMRSFNYNKMALLVCTDADRLSVEERKEQLRTYCLESNIDDCPRRENEAVMVWIPKRSIENWIHFFREYPKEVSEETVYPHGGNPDKCKEEARKMSYYLQNLKEYERVIDSLSIAKEEYLKLCNNQA